MKRYAEYKDSGIAWIGKIPKEWNTVKIKHLATENGTLLLDGDWIESDVIESDGIRYLTTGNIGAGFYKEQGSGYVSEITFVKLNCTRVFPNDLIISRLNEPIGRACLLPDTYSEYIVAVDNVIFRPNSSADKKFLVYCMNTAGYAQTALLIARGTTMARISRTQLGSICVSIPPLAIQAAIVAYLDRKTVAIDTLIADKLRLIDLLKEKRQAIISEAVTKGLDPSVPMKDSGVEWIGEIPAHWEVKRLKFAVKLRNEKSNNPDIQYVGLENVESYTGQLLFDDATNEPESDTRQANLFFAGDVMFGKLRPYLSKAFIADFNGQCSGELLVFEPKLFEPRYLLNLLLSWGFINWVDSSTYGSKMPRANWDFIGNMIVPIPSKAEQAFIIDYLAHKTATVNSLITNIAAQIEKLKEYRQAIISEAVTGKVEL